MQGWQRAQESARGRGQECPRYTDGAQLKLCRDIIPAVNTVVCRLTASIEAMKRRSGAYRYVIQGYRSGNLLLGLRN
jgi:hypothetical protein